MEKEGELLPLLFHLSIPAQPAFTVTVTTPFAIVTLIAVPVVTEASVTVVALQVILDGKVTIMVGSPPTGRFSEPL